MPNALKLRCNQLERSMRSLHDECERLMRENAVLRERMQAHASGRATQRIDDVTRIAAAPEHYADPYVIRAASMRMY